MYKRQGKVNAFILTEGGASNALVGHREMPASMLKGYRDGEMCIRDSPMVSQMMVGTAKLQLATGMHPGAMKDAVCSPGGTTIRCV